MIRQNLGLGSSLPVRGGRRARGGALALDWMAVAVAENGREIVEVYLAAARNGDWRAAEALMNRIYGNPDETVRQVDASQARAVLRSMSVDEKLELDGAPQAGAGGGGGWYPVYPVVVDP